MTLQQCGELCELLFHARKLSGQLVNAFEQIIEI
jgi:hypothetical protein